MLGIALTGGVYRAVTMFKCLHSPRSAALIAMVSVLLTPVCAAGSTSKEMRFKTFDGYELFGKLVLPETKGKHAVVIYVQTAEGATVDMKRSLGGGKTFNYHDLYRTKLPELNVGFFSYEGRGVTMGDAPPRYETIDRNIYNTSTLANKVKDVLTAVDLVRKQADVDPQRIYLMGASEGTLIAAESAASSPNKVAGLILYGVLTKNMSEDFKYIMSDGAYMVFLQLFDTDGDGKISKVEYEADPHKYRATRMSNAPFSSLDPNKDGFFTADEMKILTKVYIDACDNRNFRVLDAWTKVGAAVATPDNWFRDHFDHPEIWSFLKQLDIPVGCFQGGRDASVPISGVREMEERARKAGKKRMEFHYFEKLDHSLGIAEYFMGKPMPEGHKSIFEFISKISKP